MSCGDYSLNKYTDSNDMDAAAFKILPAAHVSGNNSILLVQKSGVPERILSG